MNKKIWFLVFDVFILIFILVLIIYLRNKSSIPGNYLFVFHSEPNDIVNETYIYKIDNGQDNLGFNYVNVVVKNGVSEITKTGSVTWTDDVFRVAQDNNAYSYITKNGDDKKYTIEEFMPLFIMN